jgi:hypothetical protein
MKNRKILPGCHIADADGPTNDPGPTDSPVLTAATGLAVRADPTNSRRAAANAAHANGATTGPPSLPAPSHPNKLPLNPDTAPRAGATDIIGASSKATSSESATTSTDTSTGSGDDSAPVSVSVSVSITDPVSNTLPSNVVEPPTPRDARPETPDSETSGPETSGAET